MAQSLLASFGFFALSWLTQVASPGPNFVRISHSALTVSRRSAMAMAAGTATGNATWCLAAAAGAAALTRHGWLGRAICLAGSLYFLMLGARLIISAGREKPTAPTAPKGLWLAYRDGIATALSNPQAILFFATVFLAFFPSLDVTTMAAAILIVTCVTLGWYWLLTGLLVSGRARQLYLRLQRGIDWLFGLILILASIRLAVGSFVAD